jgi:hypothetical protein
MRTNPNLRRRDNEIEGSFGFLTQQIRSLHKDLLAFQAKTEKRFDKMDARLDGRFDKVVGGLRKKNSRLGVVERELRGLRTDIPKIVRRAMRDALDSEPPSKP